MFLQTLYEKHDLSLNEIVRGAFPWYNFAFNTRETVESLLENLATNGLNREQFIVEVERGVGRSMSKVKAGRHVKEISSLMGKGKVLYISC